MANFNEDVLSFHTAVELNRRLVAKEFNAVETRAAPSPNVWRLPARPSMPWRSPCVPGVSMTPRTWTTI
jgi:hypothetical protein